MGPFGAGARGRWWVATPLSRCHCRLPASAGVDLADPTAPRRPGDVISHNDAAPYNTVWRDDPHDPRAARLVGLSTGTSQHRAVRCGPGVHDLLMGAIACPRCGRRRRDHRLRRPATTTAIALVVLRRFRLDRRPA